MSFAAEKLRCNICETTIEITLAKEHSVSKDHLLRRSKLEEDLKNAAMRSYGQDSSVVGQWEASI